MYSILRPLCIIPQITSNFLKLRVKYVSCSALLSNTGRPTIKYTDKYKSKETQDLIIYRYENSSFFKRLRNLSLLSYVIWLAFGYNSYKIIKLKENNAVKYEKDDVSFLDTEAGRVLSKRFILVAFALGTMLLGIISFYVKRSVRQIVLMKDKSVLFDLYHPIYGSWQITVPLSEVSGVKSRSSVKSGVLPLKVKNFMFHFLLDVKGEIRDPQIFDLTVNVKRNWTKK